MSYESKVIKMPKHLPHQGVDLTRLREVLLLSQAVYWHVFGGRKKTENVDEPHMYMGRKSVT